MLAFTIYFIFKRNLTFTDEYNEWLEKKYRIYALKIKDKNKATNQDLSECVIKDPSGTDRLRVNFKTMTMETATEKGELKRKWKPGLIAQYRTSRNMLSLKCCIYNLQVNQ